MGGISLASACPLCLKKSDNSPNFLFRCSIAIHVQKLVLSMGRLNLPPNPSAYGADAKTMKGIGAIFLSTCFSIWKARCTLFFSNIKLARSQILNSIMTDILFSLKRMKIKAKHTMMELVAVDWLKSNKREDDLGGRPGSIVQKHAALGGNGFFFIINMQVPGSTTYNLALYYMIESPLESIPQLNSFVKGDDAYRNSRFKLIPFISKGSWIVKQSVGKKACLVGQALEINYFHGKNYLELGIDVGSSSVARGVVNLVLGYLTNLVIEMAFVIQANTQEELPECLIGTCRLNHLDASKSVSIQQ